MGSSSFSRDEYSNGFFKYRRAFPCVVISIALLVAFATLDCWFLAAQHPAGAVIPSYSYGANHKGDLVLRSEVGDAEEGLELELDREAERLASEEISGGPVGDRADDDDDAVAPEGNASDGDLVDPECDLYHGQWYYDPTGPLYTNSTCPILTQSQNCQGNGRPDKEYENWRWKPSGCDLPRFNATRFLELMAGKTIAFVGDSIARNQMESLMCLLWQVEEPKNRGNRRMQRWHFRSRSVTIVRVWSAWLVHHTTEPFGHVEDDVEKLHLDVPDEAFMELVPTLDVVVFSNGHWFPKSSVYVLDNNIVGAQLYSLPAHQPVTVTNTQAFRISTRTSLTAMATHPNYTGLTIVTSYTPDHYEKGAWNTGGSCTGKIRPLAPGRAVENEFTDTMHREQVAGFEEARKKLGNGSKLRLMDITEGFSYRHDGHPGPFRSPDPNKITRRGTDGRPPPQDCLHWCMPGPVDTWNELMLEVIRREFEGGHTRPGL